jgi:hypothetical protein
VQQPQEQPESGVQDPQELLEPGQQQEPGEEGTPTTEELAGLETVYRNPTPIYPALTNSGRLPYLIRESVEANARMEVAVRAEWAAIQIERQQLYDWQKELPVQIENASATWKQERDNIAVEKA